MRIQLFALLAGLAFLPLVAKADDPIMHKKPVGKAWQKDLSDPKVQNITRCRDTAGLSQAQLLADECRFVSGATRPPCSPNNSCAMMQESIHYSCDLLYTPPSYGDRSFKGLPLSEIPDYCFQFYDKSVKNPRETAAAAKKKPH